MVLSKIEAIEFINYSARVNKVLVELLGQAPNLFDTLASTLDDDSKRDLMHIGELDAAAMALNEQSADLLSKDSSLAEKYAEFKREWLRSELTQSVRDGLKVSRIAEELVDLEDELEILETELFILDDEDKDELLEAINSAEATLTNIKASVAIIKELSK
jgi:hypothetical protein